MRVPSVLLRVSWPSPRKEMMQLWLLVLRLILYSGCHRKGHSDGGSLSHWGFLTVWTSFWFLLDGHPPLCLSLNAVDSVWSCGVKASGRILHSYSFSPVRVFPLPFSIFLTVPSPPPRSQPVSILVIWPVRPSKIWFGLFTLWVILSQISKLPCSPSYNNTYYII